MGGLAFFNSRPAVDPIVAAPELAFVDGLNMLSLALLRVGGSSELADRGTGCPDTVLFLSAAGIDERSAPDDAFAASVITSSADCSCVLSCVLVDRFVPIR